MFAAWRDLAKAMALLLLIYFPFAIWGVNIFSGEGRGRGRWARGAWTRRAPGLRPQHGRLRRAGTCWGAVRWVHPLSGMLYSCNDPNAVYETDCVGTFEVDAGAYRIVVPRCVLALALLRGAAARTRSSSNPPPSGYGAHRTSGLCLWPHSAWTNPFYFNFDNVGRAMLNQFEMASTEGWTVVRSARRRRS